MAATETNPAFETDSSIPQIRLPFLRRQRDTVQPVQHSTEMDNEKIDSRMVTRSQAHTQLSFYDDDFETECAVEIPPQHQPTKTRYVSLIEPEAVEAVTQAVTPAVDPTLHRILEQIQIQIRHSNKLNSRQMRH